jgi:hypothetical protein
MTGPAVLRFVRWLAGVGAMISALALAGGAIVFGVTLATGPGDGGLGVAIALGVGIAGLIIGGCGLVLGILLRGLATRALAQPAKIGGLRQTLLIIGSVAAIALLLAAAVVSPGWVLPGALVAGCAAGYVIVAAASRRIGVAIVAGIIAIALLAVGVVPIWLQVQTSIAHPRPPVAADRLARPTGVGRPAATYVIPIEGGMSTSPRRGSSRGCRAAIVT